MILDRQKEILHRAHHRRVSASIQLRTIVPFTDLNHVDNLGVSVRNGEVIIDTDDEGFVLQSIHVVQTNDECQALIERSPLALSVTLGKVKSRTRMSTDESFSREERMALFESESAVLEGTGIPARISMDFTSAANDFETKIAPLPFKKLSRYFSILNEKMRDTGGRVQSVDITHQSAVSAYDYYQLPSKAYGQGFTSSDGLRMLNSAYNLLGKMGAPLIQRRDPKFN